MNIRGGLTPSLFAKNVWELGGGNPSKWGMYECQMLEMYYWWVYWTWKCMLCGAPLTRANGYINFSTCMQAWGGLHLNPIDFFSWETYWNPWGNRKPGNTWGHRKYSALKTPLAYAFGFFWKQTHANKYKHMQTRSSTHRSHSEDMTLFSWDLDGPRQDLFGLDRYWNVCFAGGTNDYLSQIYSLHFPKMMCFSATQPP